MGEGFVSIIMVTYNSSRTIATCLNSLYEHHPSSNFEVLISDNRSTDETLSIIRSLNLSNLSIIQNNRNLGFGTAINIAAKSAGGEFFYLLNPDTYFIKPVLGTYLEFMSGQPDAAACTGVLLEDDGKSISTTLGWFPGWHSIFEDLGFHVLRRWIDKSRLARVSRPTRADFISGASIFMRKSVFESVGGFDENYFLYFEDTDLFLRIKKSKNLSPYVLPDSELIHVGGYSAKSSEYDPVLGPIFSGSKLYFFNKHYGQFAATLIGLTDRFRTYFKRILRA